MKSKLILIVGLLLFLNVANAQLITIHPDSITNKIPPFGYNMIAANQGFGIIGEDGNFDPAILATLKEMKLELLRFPGGTYANLYEWKKAIGPKEQRGGMHGYRYTPENNWYGPDEAAQLMEETGGQLVCVVNFNKGAQYAADWVEYMNAEVGTNPNGGVEWASVRAQNGHPEPYGVKYWEIANEGGNEKIWPRWGYEGDEQLEWNDPVFQDRAVYGGVRSYTNQRLVRHNAWDTVSIRTLGEVNEVFQIRWFPVEKESVSLKIGNSLVDTISWIRVDNFCNSGPTDKHYTVDGYTGEVQFGDGQQGLVPPAGEYVYVDYMTQHLDGHVQIYNAMKATDPSIEIAEAFFFIHKDYAPVDENVKSDGAQHHMGLEKMKGFKHLYEENILKDAVSIAAGGFPMLLEKSIMAYFDKAGHYPDYYLTEYSIFDGTWDSVNSMQLSRTITFAIYFAIVNAEIAAHGSYVKVAGINYLANYNNNKESALEEGKSYLHANGVLTSLYSNYFGKNRILTDTINIPTQKLSYKFNTNETEEQNVPKLYSHASVNPEKNDAYLMVINTTDSDTLEAGITGIGNSFSTLGLSAIKTLKSTSLTAINSEATPNNIYIENTSLPTVLSDTINHVFDPATVTVFVFKYNCSYVTDGGEIGQSDESMCVPYDPTPIWNKDLAVYFGGEGPEYLWQKRTYNDVSDSWNAWVDMGIDLGPGLSTPELGQITASTQFRRGAKTGCDANYHWSNVVVKWLDSSCDTVACPQITDPGQIAASSESHCGSEYTPTPIWNAGYAEGSPGYPMGYMWQSRTYDFISGTWGSWVNLGTEVELGLGLSQYQVGTITEPLQFRRGAKMSCDSDYHWSNVVEKWIDIPGTPCDDGDPVTINDVLDSNCSCVGELAGNKSARIDPAGSTGSQEVVVYPNPVGNRLYLETSLTVEQLEIISMDLKSIKTVDDWKQGIDVSELSSGMYLLKVNAQEKDVVVKFLK